MRNIKKLFWGTIMGTTASIITTQLLRCREHRQSLALRAGGMTRHAVRHLGTPAEFRFVTIGNIRLHTIVAGPEDGPLAVLLHGFPECWYSWRRQIPILAEAGYRVVAPDQRGYNLSDKPTGVQSYQLDRLTADVAGLIQAFNHERAIILGHDWGGVAAWRFAMDYPDMVEKLVVMNAPHPAAYAREVGRGWAQRLKSWYILFFQVPWLPETLLTLSPETTSQLFFRRTAVRTDAFSDADLEMMTVALAQPGALRTMIHWYRAAMRHPPARRTQVIDKPTLLIWGEEDVALGLPLTYGLEKWVPNLTTHYIPACGHWVQNEAADEVNAQILAFLGKT